MEGDWYNNKREDCMIRKEDTIYFDELTVLYYYYYCHFYY